MKNCGVNFVGNIEGRDIAEGKVDGRLRWFHRKRHAENDEGTGKFFMQQLKRVYNSTCLQKYQHYW